MAKKQTNKRSGREVGRDEVDGNVDKIRNILFGSQMRDYEQRLDVVEKRLAQNIERTARGLEKRIERLDGYAHREVDKLTVQLRAERKDRLSERKKGASELNELAGQVETWFAEVDEQLSQEAKELRDSIRQQTEDLTTQIRNVHDQVQASLQKEASELANAKLGREDMAALLTEVAMRLNKDFKIPKAERK